MICLPLSRRNFLLLVYKDLTHCAGSKMMTYVAKATCYLVNSGHFVMLSNAGRTLVLGIEWTVLYISASLQTAALFCTINATQLFYMFVMTKGSPHIITSVLKETPCHFRSNARAGLIKLIIESIFMIKIEALSAKVCLDHRERSFNWAKIR